MKSFSPIALFCFKRLDTLVLCIESLKSCPEAIHSDLIIFSDASRNDEEWQKVDEIRSYIKNINGFKSIRIIQRQQNFGVDYNIIKGIQQMSEEYDRFIVVEDDLIFSNQFLRFLNSGLNHFKSFEKVLTLSAFNFVKIPKNYIWDCYFAGRSNPWGWATWSNKIKEVDWDLALKNNFLSNKVEIRTFNKWGSDRSRMLKRTLKGEIRAWDILLEYYQFKKGLVTAFSSKNMVINNGFNRVDASNTTGYNRFKVEFIDFPQFDLHFPDFLPSNPIINKKIIEKNSFFMRFKTKILKILNYKNKYC
jgi:hypothetical protein